VVAEVPELAGDDALGRAMHASLADTVRLFITMLSEPIPPQTAQPPPGAVAFAHELVRRGVGVDALLRSYQVSAAAFFEQFVARVHADPRLAPDAATANEQAAQWLFAFVGALSHGIVERYAEEGERWVRSAAASRVRDVLALLAGEQLDAQTMSARLRYPLDRTHLAIIVWADPQARSEDPPLGAVLERTASELAAAFGATGSLIVGLEEGLVAAWLFGPALNDERVSQVRLDTSTTPRVSAACGLPAAGVSGFRRSYEQALQARRVAQLLGRHSVGVIGYADVGLAAIATADTDQARDFVRRELGSLVEDSDDARRLTATLRVYLDEGPSARRAAQRLGVHENTIKNRIRAAEEQLGHPAGERVAELLVALRLASIARPAKR
jgi:DNA-binding PucR family transcriptional regulator